MYIFVEREGQRERESHYDSSYIEFLDFSFQRIPWNNERGQ